MHRPPDEVFALKVRQWLPEWDEIDFDDALHRARPQPFFLQFALSAVLLKRLTGVHKRDASQVTPRVEDLGSQRGHDADRSKEIAEYVRFGFPWSELPPSSRTPANRELRKPGWLPTSVLINILEPGDDRAGRRLHSKDAVSVTEVDDRLARLHLPKGLDSRWSPDEGGTHPFEVIDGQHRLWAFDGTDVPVDFELPVVAFLGLARSWQAYLFWTINIKPKKINASLAYDLYPLLRSEAWLDKFSGPYVYREARAQELVEVMWGHPRSPWHRRINMLGEARSGKVRQAAWVRALTATLVRPHTGRSAIGGLFGAEAGGDEPATGWTRAQQAAFLIRAWCHLRDQVEELRPHWVSGLEAGLDAEPLIFREGSLLDTDPGVRAFLGVVNDLTMIGGREGLDLADWVMAPGGAQADYGDVDSALESLSNDAAPLDDHLRLIGRAAARVDWRSLKAPGLSDQEKTVRMTFRGSGGYSQLKRHALKAMAEDRTIAEFAAAALSAMGDG